MNRNLLSFIRAAGWALAMVAFVAALALGFAVDKKNPIMPYSEGLSGIGGAFVMRDTHGKPFTDKDLKGKPTVMFFGYTTCPDICPTTLTEMSTWLTRLGGDASKINVVFVSIDPARDTPEQMGRYLALFDKRIIGLTGSPAELAIMAKAYRIYYKAEPLGNDNYTMDHTASIYLLNGKQQLVGTIDYHENDEIAFGKIQRLASSH